MSACGSLNAACTEAGSGNAASASTWIARLDSTFAPKRECAECRILIGVSGLASWVGEFGKAMPLRLSPSWTLGKFDKVRNRFGWA
jgi:hypothetical protein